jgi:hypothetical protein
MPSEVINGKTLEPGDVVMVARQMEDKVTRRPFVWRYFLVVTRSTRWVVAGIIVGAEKATLKDKEFTIDLNDEKNEVQRLTPEEWPDGLLGFRMAMVLKGLIPDIV